MIKPNLGELAALAGKEWINENEIETIAGQILKEKKCELIIVSMGEEGAMAITSTGSSKIKAPVVERKSTVGAGDSMVAGIVLSLSKGWSIQRAVQYGVACGTAATMNPGTELCHKDDADNLFERIRNSSTTNS